MTTTALLALVIQFGPSIIPLVAKLVSDISAGKANATVTPEDMAELMRLQGLTSADIYKTLGIAPPPAA